MIENKIISFGKCSFLSGAILASAMLAGCSSEAGSVLRGFNGSGDDVLVSVSFADADKALSRAADGLDTSTSGFSLMTSVNGESKVRVMVDQNDGTYSPFDYSITGAAAISAPDPAPKFKSGVNSVNVYGWYPAKSLENFSVAADQSGNNGYCLSDLMVATGSTCVRDALTGLVMQEADLSFAHVMSKVKVNLSLAADVTVTSVKLKSMSPQVTVTANKSGNAVTGYDLGTAGGTASDITLLSNGSLTSESSAADKVLCGVFPPQQKSGNFLEITASYNQGSAQTITYSLGSAKTFARGSEYTMNITLDGSNVTTGTVNIGDWSSTDGTVTIGHGALVLNTYTLDDLVAGGSAGTVTVSDNTVTNVTVASADPDVATAAVSTNTVTITPVAAGTTQVIVSAEKNGTKLFGVVSVTVTGPSYLTLASMTATDMIGELNRGTSENPRVWVICESGHRHLCQNGTEVDPSSDAGNPTYLSSGGTADGTLSCGGKKVAVVCYVYEAGKVDKSTGSTGYKGLAIAIEDANDATVWTITNNVTCVAQNSTIETALNEIQNDNQWWTGIGYTNQMADASGACTGHTHLAAQYARNYSSEQASSTNYSHTPPSGCSQWFLPTIAQWNLIVMYLVLDITGLTDSAYSSYQAEYVNKYIVTAAGATGVQAVHYWSSVEYNTGNAWTMNFLDGNASTAGKLTGVRVRPVLAF